MQSLKRRLDDATAGLILIADEKLQELGQLSSEPSIPGLHIAAWPGALPEEPDDGNVDMPLVESPLPRLAKRRTSVAPSSSSPTSSPPGRRSLDQDRAVRSDTVESL